ncbi:ACN9-domain-containing protein [Tilletiaria anomala UBC 951]|uniref:Succinate dehydrogenase assembly factor 3 n=1 Tax=Tilletiaria anomala (strain ATCC 24038 / CBS 436.72 / UBC 951) TaxID=1037660 RepID=A0A066WEJ2_TILAU|nr:ACN9-domain-containing protein [Tilletiaria anomala UBC 951]KDN49185.1 ACN9-domain-containing protein [Tilletiaria anomala UBC 951]
MLRRGAATAFSGSPPSSVASDAPSAAVSTAAQSLLPPIQLYRRLFRAHRQGLNPEMRSLGDNYVKDEFRRHRAIDNPLQIVGFLSSWKMYLDTLELEAIDSSGGVGSSPSVGSAKRKCFEGRRLDPDMMEKLSEEQLYQLHELMQATQEVYDPNKAQAKPPGKK